MSGSGKERRRAKRVGFSAGVVAVAIAGLLVPAVSAEASTPVLSAAAMAQPAVASQESSCPVGLKADVPSTAAVAARGAAAIVPADATAQTAAGMAKSEVLKKAAAQNVKWVTSLDCIKSNISNGSGVATTSSNWSGYRYQGIDYQHAFYEQASMLWTVPTAESGVAFTSRNDSIWPGIGSGSSKNDDLVQAGTQTVAGPAGYQGTYAWLEVYPTMPTESIISSFKVDAGDIVGSIVDMNALDQAFFDVCDYTKNVCASAEEDLSYTTTAKNYGLLQGQQAEWIAERPGIPTGLSELNKFGTLQITDAQGYEEEGGGTSSDLFVINGINNQPGVTKQQVEMTSCNGKTALTGYPSIPDLNGSFTIPWKNNGSLEKC